MNGPNMTATEVQMRVDEATRNVTARLMAAFVKSMDEAIDKMFYSARRQWFRLAIPSRGVKIASRRRARVQLKRTLNARFTFQT